VAKKQLTCQVSVRFEPLPPEKRAAYYHAFDLLAELLLSDLENDIANEAARFVAGETFKHESPNVLGMIPENAPLC
jgi:hypothetical protein